MRRDRASSLYLHAYFRVIKKIIQLALSLFPILFKILQSNIQTMLVSVFEAICNSLFNGVDFYRYTIDFMFLDTLRIYFTCKPENPHRRMKKPRRLCILGKCYKNFMFLKYQISNPDDLAINTHSV